MTAIACTCRLNPYDSCVAMNSRTTRRVGRRTVRGAAVVAALLLLAPSLATAQRENRPESIVVKTKRIEKILGHRLGYRVFYIRADQSLASFFAPNSWFNTAGGAGEMIFGDGPEYPYFQVYYLDGEIDLVRLFVRRSRRHLSWGTLRGDPAVIEPQFDVDRPNIEF